MGSTSAVPVGTVVVVQLARAEAEQRGFELFAVRPDGGEWDHDPEWLWAAMRREAITHRRHLMEYVGTRLRNGEPYRTYMLHATPWELTSLWAMNPFQEIDVDGRLFYKGRPYVPRI